MIPKPTARREASPRRRSSAPSAALLPAAAALLVAVLSSCSAPSDGDAPEAGAKPLVHATNYPLYHFASRLAGDLVELRFDAPADEDPAFWEPEDDTIASMQGAALVLLNGAGHENWLELVTLPTRILIDTSAAFADEHIEIEDAVVHSHGDGEEHSHDGTAFTTWLDFRLAARQAGAVRDALAALLPEAAETIAARADALLADLEALDAEMEALASRIGDRPLVASHPVYQYWERRYGLSVRSVHWEPEDVPGEVEFAELDEALADHPAEWMLWEGEPEEESVALLEGRGIASVVFDPCGNRPEKGDWFDAMRENLRNLEAIAAAP